MTDLVQDRLKSFNYNLILWPVLLVSCVHLFVSALNGNVTNDFAPVYTAVKNFINHRPVYGEDLSTVDPHYLYSLAGTLILSPLGVLSYNHSRELLIILTVVALFLGVYLLLKRLEISYKSPIFAIICILLVNTETVVHSESFTNINGVIFLIEVIFLLNYKSSSKTKRYLSGVLMGLSICIKPILAPLLLLPLMTLAFESIVSTILITVIANFISYFFIMDPKLYFTKTIPYLLTSRNFYNSAIAPLFSFFGINSILTIILELILSILVIGALFYLYRIRNTDNIIFSFTSSGILILTEFLLGNLGQGYYSMMLLPLIFSFLRNKNYVSNYFFWIGVTFCMLYTSWQMITWVWLGDLIDYWRFTLGWIIMLLSTCLSIIYAPRLTRVSEIDE